MESNSVTLSGTKASQHVSATKGDLKTYEVFRSDAICAAWTVDEGTSLRTEEDCRLAMVWIALLAGGDYVPEGIDTFGMPL
jgi:Holliday junction resolvase YEN1